MRRRFGEWGDANLASADLGWEAIPYILMTLGARPEDTFNCDESGFVFLAQPYRTLTLVNVSVAKKVVDMYTVLFCCNATGTERLKLLMLRPMHRARDWGRVNAEGAWHATAYVHWHKAPKAWMNREIFNTWLNGVIQDFQAHGRKFFLIMDNCSAHYVTHAAATKFVMKNVNVSVDAHCFSCAVCFLCCHGSFSYVSMCAGYSD